MDTDLEQQLNHSDIVESFMHEYGGRVESAEEVFGDDSVYTAIVKVIFCICVCACVCAHLLCLCLCICMCYNTINMDAHRSQWHSIRGKA